MGSIGGNALNAINRARKREQGSGVRLEEGDRVCAKGSPPPSPSPSPGLAAVRGG